MKILILSHRVPYPLRDGGVIAMHSLLHGLKKSGAQVKLVCLNPKKDNVDTGQLPSYFFDDFGFEAFDIDTDIKPIDAFTNLFTPHSYHMVRFYNAGFDALLERIFSKDKYDIVHLESLFVTGYLLAIRKFYNGPVAMRAHNVEHRIWEKLAQNEGNPIKKWYLGLLARRLKKYETQTLPKLEALVTLTQEDADFFAGMGFKGKTYVSAHGIELDKFDNTVQPTGDVDVFHLGSMDWIPNQEAMRWFLDEIWPLVLKENPNAHFYLAGKKIPQWFYERTDNNVTIVGEVPNATQFMQQHYIMVVPLLSGSGIRVKILEGMALGKPIIATPMAATGIAYTQGTDILISDKPATIAAQLTALLQNSEMRTNLGQNARLLIERKYNNNTLCQDLLGFYMSVQ